MRRTLTLEPAMGATVGMFVGLLVVGIGSQLAGANGGSLADLLVGLAVGCSGAIVIARRPRDPVGWLLVSASLLWFVSTVAFAPGAAGSLGREMRFAYRGPLLTMLVAPIWGSRSPGGLGRWAKAASVAVIAGACAVSLGPAATSAEGLGIVAGMSGAVAIAGLVDGVLAPRRTAWAAALPATLLWVAAATISLRLSGLDPGARLLAYQAGVAGAALAMGASRLGRPGTVDEVVNVGRVGGLGGALGDHSLRIGFQDPDGAFRAFDGSPVVPVGSQASTELELGADGRARILHRSGVLDDVRIRVDVEAAARLLAEHHRLTSEVQRYAGSVSASRARLVAAADRASGIFGAELDRRVLPHLDLVLDALDTELREAWEPRNLATAVRKELTDLAVGSAPSQLGAGLPAALRAMAHGAPIAVELALDQIDIDEERARTLYFVAAEAVSNAIKHSGANTIAIGLRALERGAELSIDDDGDGAIALRSGGGLMGLSDRLAAAGGTLVCARSPLGGASVIARLPDPTEPSHPMGSHSGIVIKSV